MKQFLMFVLKEFFHVLRDRKTLFILFGMPIAQITLFGFALTNELKNSKIIVVDNAKDQSSQAIITKFESSRYFEIEKTPFSQKEILEQFRNGKIKAAIVLPANFNNDLMHQHKAQIQVLADASDPNTATTITNYASAIINDYQKDINNTVQIPYQIKAETRMLYNPQMKGVHNFVPGVMAMVLMLICVMMTAISIVKEKEMGTMEILLVSPFRPIMVILAKAVPYFILSLINLGTILLLSVYAMDLPIQGSLLLLVLESALFITCCLVLGILISINTTSQQLAMLVSLVGMLMPTMIFSGFMFPIENMPKILQLFSNIVPSKWFYIIVKNIMIKGLGFESVWKETLILLGITLFLLLVSLRKFKIRLE
ncbi:ABC transporter permease [Flavobacterium sp.]|uniref:ABC transporter permease n=1 Tax=Flavobacterium sp. TaxID=239 RepID=UPI0028BD8B6E|nr:ABC transporter permease [Flavobacterium sp.]